ncbi:glycosyltransferase family 4 protein, partial [Microbacterium sp.]|uniref:glycosyltransferase family 4 protein n=1 Tax=Microbacterium sp. TaxID=51671 RepID=UPI003F9E258B
LRRLRPDLLHTHLAFADLAGIAAVAGLRAGSGRRIRVVSTEHGISGVRGYYQSSPAKARLRAAAHRARLLRTDRVIAVSESTAQQVSEQWGSGAKVSVIRNGVNRLENAPDPQPGLRVLSLSRLAPEKRIDQLIRAFALVALEHPAASLTIAGIGPEEHSLKQVVADHGLGPQVGFPGHVDAAGALAAHDVVAQLSVWENLSYTLLDATAHGLGVVAADVGGNREIVPERSFVDAMDLPGVARAIVEQGQDLGARPSRSAVQTVAAMCTEIAGVYEEVMA